MWNLCVGFILFGLLLSTGNSKILRPCPQSYSSYYLADDTDPCVFFWCLNGELVSDTPMSCAPGSGVKRGYEGEGNPCTLHLPGCRTSSHPSNGKSGYGGSYGGSNQGSYGWPNQGSQSGSNQGSYGGSNQGSYGGSNQGSNGGSNQGSYGGSNQGSNGGSNQGSNHGHYGYGGKGGSIWIVPVHIPAATPSPTAMPPPAPTAAPGPAPALTNGPAPGALGQHGHYAATAYLTQNAHVPGGQLQPHVNSLKYCWKACVYSFECKGFDFDTHYGTCWLHTDDTICDTLVGKSYVNSYRLIHCPSTTPTTMPTTVTMMMTSSTVSANPVKTPIANFTGMHLQGGNLRNGVATVEACFAECLADPNCQGVDFDTNGNTCWVHTMASECGNLIAKSTCTHFRCVQCETPIIFPNAHSLGGTLITGITDPTTCFGMCVNTCVAIDFDSSTMTCWHHTVLTCAALEIKPQCVHFRRPGLCP